MSFFLFICVCCDDECQWGGEDALEEEEEEYEEEGKQNTKEKGEVNMYNEGFLMLSFG